MQQSCRKRQQIVARHGNIVAALVKVADTRRFWQQFAFFGNKVAVFGNKVDVRQQFVAVFCVAWYGQALKIK